MPIKKAAVTPRFTGPLFALTLFLLLCQAAPAQAQAPVQSEPSAPSFKPWVEMMVSVFGTGLALFTFWRGFEQYQSDQKWKRTEFVSQQVKEFEACPDVRNVMLMLDWNARPIRIPEAYPLVLPPDNFFPVNDMVLCDALDACNLEEGMPTSETYIRDAFSKFLDYLERFEIHIKTQLATQEQLEPYLRYWLNLLSPKQALHRKADRFYDLLWRFIDSHGYIHMRELMQRYNIEIPAPKASADVEQATSFTSQESVSLS